MGAAPHRTIARRHPLSGAALLIVGDPSVGKTALLEAARSMAESATVVATVGVESEAELSFAALRDRCDQSLSTLNRPGFDGGSLGWFSGVAGGRPGPVIALAVIMLVAALSETTLEQGEIREEACPLLPLR